MFTRDCWDLRSVGRGSPARGLPPWQPAPTAGRPRGGEKTPPPKPPPAAGHAPRASLHDVGDGEVGVVLPEAGVAEAELALLPLVVRVRSAAEARHVLTHALVA